MRRIKLSLLIASLVLLMLANCTIPTNVRVHPDFVKQPDRIKKIAILPIDCYVEQLNLGENNERDSKREREIIEQLETVIPRILASQRYDTLSIKTPKDSLGYIEYSKNYDLFRNAYLNEMSTMYGKDKKVGWKTITLYPSQIPLEYVGFFNADPADAMLFVRYSGFRRSTGNMTAGIAGGVAVGLLTGAVVVPIPEGGSMQAALIDRKSGKILWHNFSKVETYSLDNLIESLFENFPDYNENLAYYINHGKEIKHPFRAQDYDQKSIDSRIDGEDCITIDDGRKLYGEVINISKKNFMLKHRRTLYIISKKRISSISMSDHEITIDEASKLDFPRVNYNLFDERIEIY